jgi:hypothetical protein
VSLRTEREHLPFGDRQPPHARGERGRATVACPISPSSQATTSFSNFRVSRSADSRGVSAFTGALAAGLGAAGALAGLPSIGPTGIGRASAVPP